MALISNLTAFVAAISAVCPIDGAAADGVIWYSASATPSQIAAAQAVAASYVDAPAQLVSIATVLAALTDTEYTALMQEVQARIVTRPGLHRAFFSQRTIDLTKPAVQNLIQAIVTAGILTPQRAAAVFVAPPPPPSPPVVSQ